MNRPYMDSVLGDLDKVQAARDGIGNLLGLIPRFRLAGRDGDVDKLLASGRDYLDDLTEAERPVYSMALDLAAHPVSDHHGAWIVVPRAAGGEQRWRSGQARDPYDHAGRIIGNRTAEMDWARIEGGLTWGADDHDQMVNVGPGYEFSMWLVTGGRAVHQGAEAKAVLNTLRKDAVAAGIDINTRDDHLSVTYVGDDSATVFRVRYLGPTDSGSTRIKGGRVGG